MISNILWYFIIGVALNFSYDKSVDYTESKHRFTSRERFIVTMFWPIVLIIFIWSFVQVTKQK